MSRSLGTVVRGVRAPIIRQGDDIVEITVKAVLDAMKENGIEAHDRDVVAVTESVVARAQGNYASVEQIAKDVKAKTGGADVISLKGATFDGIAMSTFRIVESILKNQNTVLPVAHVLGKEYGEELEGSCISIPCVVNADGIAKAIKITLTDKEREQVEHSAEVLRNFIDDVMKED